MKKEFTENLNCLLFFVYFYDGQSYYYQIHHCQNSVLRFPNNSSAAFRSYFCKNDLTTDLTKVYGLQASWLNKSIYTVVFIVILIVKTTTSPKRYKKKNF